jgi:poly [ADP-ribose] polymerase
MQQTTRSKRNGKAEDDTNNGNNNLQAISNVDLESIKKEKKKASTKKIDQSNTYVINEENSLQLDIENLNKSTQEMIVKGIKKGNALVDPLIPNAFEYHVIADTSNLFNGKSFDCTLNQSNLRNNNNKFYIIQLLALDKYPNQFSLSTRWGRIGYDGQKSKIVIIFIMKGLQ